MYCSVRFITLFGLILGLRAQDLLETVEAVVGHSAELPCNTTAEREDDNLNILAWYKNGSSTAFYSSRDLRSDGELSATTPEIRYQLLDSETTGVSKLQIISVRPSDAGVYLCLADFIESPSHKTYAQLLVIEPPQRLWVIHENGTRVATVSAGSNTSRNIGPYYVGDTVHLFCVVFGGKPQASMTWSTEQRLLKDTSTPLSEHRVRSDLMFGPLRREDHGRVLTCNANNNDHVPPLSIDIILDMYLAPELVSVRVEGHQAGGRVHAGESLVAQCRVFGARPLPLVLWRLSDTQLDLQQNYTVEAPQRMVTSEISLKVDSSHDEATLTCCSPAHRRASDEYVCAQGLPLYVTYEPVLHIVADDEPQNKTIYVVKGSNVTLNCTYKANPTIYELMWFHEEDIVGRAEGESSLEPALSLHDVSETDAGEYICSATNEEGTAYSEPVAIDVTYPAFCEEESISQFGLAEDESINITCKVRGNPTPTSYRWVLVNDAVNISTLADDRPYVSLDTHEPVLLYRRPNETAYSTIFCWGNNGVEPTVSTSLASACTYLITDETPPQPPNDCVAIRNLHRDITVTCIEGHNGGMPQKFKFSVKDLDSEDLLLSITSVEPKFIIQETSQENYKFEIVAFNEKGDSKVVEIDKENIVDENTGAAVPNTVTNITTLALALCGGVALVALVACGLVLCTQGRSDTSYRPPYRPDPPLCAYNTEESNCETFHDSDDGSECNIRRTESFRRAMSRYPSKSFDVRRSSSFHSAKYIDEGDPPTRQHSGCRVHSLQNIRRRDVEVASDQIMHLPDASYNLTQPITTFYTMPRKGRHKTGKEATTTSDEASVITQTSDGFSLPPPPDEFGTYRAGTRIKDIPTKTTPTYTTIRKNSSGREPKHQQYSNVLLSPMNTVGLPTISGQSLYSYPVEHHQMSLYSCLVKGLLGLFSAGPHERVHWDSSSNQFHVTYSKRSIATQTAEMTDGNQNLYLL